MSIFYGGLKVETDIFKREDNDNTSSPDQRH